MKYRIEIPYRSCGWIDVERDEAMTNDELVNSITKDELCGMELFDPDGYDTLSDVQASINNDIPSMEITINEETA